jgi:drug/metabolite transporter (DMT)-like permease
MHVVQLGGSHYAQYLGMSAGVAALIIACQPLLTAFIAGSLVGTLIALAGVTAATLYQRHFSPKDPMAAAAVQFTTAAIVFAPLAFVFENFYVDLQARLLGVSALYYLLRHGEAARVTSMMYLPPVFAVVLEAAWFGLCRARLRSPASP